MANAAQITLTGHVQGVGFRPFVYRLAKQHQLTGYVQNRLGEVDIIACGHPDSLEQFQIDLIEQAPPLAKPRVTQFQRVESVYFDAFEIISSCSDANAQILCQPTTLCVTTVERNCTIPMIGATTIHS